MANKAKNILVAIRLTQDEKETLNGYCKEVVKLKLGPWAKHLMFREVQEYKSKREQKH